jgi:uncharacterized cofD-like protein
MNNHALGNLLLTALWDRDNHPVSGIAKVGELLKIVGHVLPMALEPLDIEGVFESGGKEEIVRGQIQVATHKGNLKSLKLIPEKPECTPASLEAIKSADFLTFGPGSWFSSVMPHFLLKEQADAILNSKAKKVVIFNLPEEAGVGEFAGMSAAEHLELILSHVPDFQVDFAIVDNRVAKSSGPLADLITKMGGKLILGDFSLGNGQNHHNIEKLISTFSHIFI